MLRIYSLKGYKIWSILLIIIIVLSIFACTVQDASANPVAVGAVALTVLGATVIAMGVGFEGSTNFQEYLTSIYDDLMYDTKMELAAIGIAGYTVFKLSQSAFYNIADTLSGFLTEQYEAFTQTGKYSIIWSKNVNMYDAYEEGLSIFGFNEGQTFSTVSYGKFGAENTAFFLSGEKIGISKPINTSIIYLLPSSLEISSITLKLTGDTIITGAPLYKLLVNMYRDDYSTPRYNTYQTMPFYLSGATSSTVYPGLVNGQPETEYNYYPEYVNQRILDNAIDDGILGEQDIASGVGSNSIDSDTPITIPVQSLGDDVISDVNTWTPSDVVVPGAVAEDIPISISGESEIVGDGTGTGIFEGIGKWVLNIPILGSILQILINILQSIQDLTAVTDFTLDFSPLKVGLTEVFPFCIPFDFVRLITVYSHSPSDYAFSIDLDTTYWSIHHTVDLLPFRMPIIFFRWVVTLFFTYILISRTRDFMKW